MKPVSLCVVLFASTLLINAVARAQADPKFYIFLCFGQSNSEGSAGLEDVDNAGVDPRFRMLACVDFPAMNRKAGNWYDAVPPLCRPNNGLCPADYFGRTLLAGLPPDVRVGVVNVSVSGCKIELFDKDHYQAYVDEQVQKKVDWMLGIIKAYNGNPYQKLVDMAKVAQREGVIKGIVLHQGESDTNDKLWPSEVKVVYDNLVKDLNLDPTSVPLLAGELVGVDQHGVCASHNAIIDELPKTLPNSYVISSAGCESQPDHLHFTKAGYRELGKRYGEKMLTLLGRKMPQAPISATSRAVQ